MKVQTALRFDKDLLELVKAKAKAQKRSLNNYIEFLLYQDVGNIPNTETQQAIYEAHNDINLTKIPNLDKYLEDIMNDRD
ncbi:MULTISPECIES: hypothetical protein [Aequorivita]|jgi:hypothetical protein|uniref:Toxin-antitoxin system protein n=2 Tax=Aequorivita TaxID=153265 RepID=A0AB35YRS7_9FLAO|nr:hypothetical protein [Aequorivita sp. Ant34-E75]WGF93451.1 hypothetical protein QCQ61_04475 [Aequorivita sp. Ant34-E75]